MTTTPDDREAILARLAEVLGNVRGVENFYRNDVSLPEGRAPLILMLDGDEAVDEDAYARGNRPAGSAKVVVLQPEVYIMVKDDPAAVGPELSLLRRRVVRDVLTDADLLALAKDKDVRYEGMQTGLAMGRSMAGEAALNFSIRYVLDVGQLPEEPTED